MNDLFTTSFNCKVCGKIVVLKEGRGECECGTKYTFSSVSEEKEITIIQDLEEENDS